MRKLKPMLLMALLLSVQVLWAQISVTGRVTEERTGTGIAGATISVKNGTANAVTNADGNFTINVPQNVTLVVSYVGFRPQEVPASSSPISVRLVPGDNSLNEVVVVGYGTKLKRDVTSSVAKVSARDFENLPLPSFEQALQGRAAGVFINSGSGKLGQALNIRVRGISSISASQQPFVVIDGVPVVSQSLGSATEPDNPLATINPDDIESIEVLKDAAAAAIYGARASNGVLLVTTKSGKQGRTKVSAGAYYGWSEPTRKAKFLNATQYRELFTAAAENEGYDAAEEFAFETGTDDWNSTNNTNWADQAFQKGSIQQYTASATGGDARTRFLISGSYNDQKGILIGNRLTRGTARINIDHNLSQRFRVGTNISLSQSNNYRVPSDNAFSNPIQLNALPPIQALKAADGLNNRNTLYYNNLIELEGNNRNLNKTYRTISSAFLEYAIAPGLRFRSQNGIDFTNFQESQFLGRRTLDGAPTGYSFDNQVTSTIFTTTNTLNYNKSVGGSGNIDALAGIEYQKGLSRGASVEGRAFPSDRFTRIQNAAIISNGSSSETEFRFVSYFARANYKINDRYLVGVSARTDGSSRFGKDNRYGFFPAVSAGWVLSEENFLKNSNTVSFLKLRSSYGRTGNAEIGNFSALPLYTSLPYADIAGLITSQIADPALSWESTDQFDIGLDFGFLNNRITGELDYFNKNTKDLLLSRPLPATSGFTAITQNIGDMTNKGFEFVLNANILQGGAFRWTSSFNISTYRNEVTRLVSPITPGQRTLGRLAVGQPYGQFYGRKYMGVNPENGDALYLAADGKTTNDYNLGVDTILGDPNPDFYGGWNNRFSYKGFDLDVQAQFVSGNDVYNVAGFFQSVNGDYFDNQTVDQLNYWKNPGDITSIPQPRLYAGNGAGKSSRWVQDGSYLRIKSVNLGYNIPRNVLRNAKIESARVYVAAQNLFTFTKYKGYDPEVNTTYVGNLNLGHDFYTPPQARTISVGVNIGL
ncbi:TonB-linked outer membrane protein, SusC/RagA family [Cnuella takakiae]|uniref:TonB-linked outer membrane protein, SusC/RagA family n=1 Tax=Cnuella takakiae TaxID=1302690 RepID=A0A1M5D3M1_9BACT|nr:TonB-dependent receptor [Cnuella takakiae]OLY94116.1 SusC/RagA family TonB-linked outer membrane protein [Cnuella takakiae]SHF61609.1 TonB-linked outer membrane protein, SusC/RagA family [Cnuella takakiae]